MPRTRRMTLRIDDENRVMWLHAVPSPSPLTKRSGMDDARILYLYKEVFGAACQSSRVRWNRCFLAFPKATSSATAIA